jgi:hypothetical protein
MVLATGATALTAQTRTMGTSLSFFTCHQNQLGEYDDQQDNDVPVTVEDGFHAEATLIIFSWIEPML